MKKQTIIATIMILMLIGFVSAQVSLSPNSFSIDAYPGETKNISTIVSTDKTDIVFLDSSNPFVTISPSELIVHNGDEILLDIIFSKNTPLGVLSFIINVSTEETIIEVPVPGDCPSCRGGGGTRTVYVDRNNTEYISLDTEYEDLDINITDIDQDINQTDISDEPDKIGFWKRFWNWLKRVFYKG